MAFTYKDTHLNNAQLDKLAESLVKVLIGGAFFAWAGWRTSKLKHYTFLIFSAYCFVVALLGFGHTMQIARTQSKAREQEQLRKLGKNLNEAIQQATDGGVPQIKPTGMPA